MERVNKIIKILDFAIEDVNLPFVEKLIKEHNPIDILVKDIDEDILKEIGTWEQSKMLDTIFMLLSSQSLLDTVLKYMESVRENYRGSTIILDTAYPSKLLNSNNDTTLTILFVIVTFYKIKRES